MSPKFLNKHDWLPFREGAKQTNAFIMLGHVKLSQVDSEYLTSFSKKIVQGIIRDQWKHEGILITDDLNMGSVFRSRWGIRGVAIKSLNAGVDYLLLSYDGEQFYNVMDALIQAEKQNQLDFKQLQKSNLRITKMKKSLHYQPRLAMNL
ncbi:MAG: beta-N-acetylhexosaminidase [bacterium]|jgi:beta-N-acetylhexosaminidase